MISGTDNWCRQVGEYNAVVAMLLARLSKYNLTKDAELVILIDQLREVQRQGDQLMGKNVVV